MRKNLFSPTGSRAAVPDGVRLYAIGDIHGCAGPLDRLVEAIEEDERQSAPGRIVFLGDYVDRGANSRGVINRLIALAERRPGTVFLKGNHEAALLEFLSDPGAGYDWLYWGGQETLESYGLDRVAARAPEDLADEFRRRLPPAHLDFFRSLELWRGFGDYVFVHAGVKPGVAIEDQDERHLLWIREEFHHCPKELRPPQTIVHGHHPVRRPFDADWRICVDTGACYGGKLTAVALEGTRRRFIAV